MAVEEARKVCMCVYCSNIDGNTTDGLSPFLQIPWNILERLLQPILSLAVKTNKYVIAIASKQCTLLPSASLFWTGYQLTLCTCYIDLWNLALPINTWIGHLSGGI